MKIGILLLAATIGAQAQGRSKDLAPILAKPIQTPETVTYQIRQYLYQRMAKLPASQGTIFDLPCRLR